MRAGLKSAALVGGFLLAISLAFYPEIATPTRILADYDVWTYFYPLRTYAAEAIRAGRFPLWNPDTFMGAPFFANSQTSLLYPGTVLFYLVWVPYAYSLSILLHVWLCAVGTYLFLRRSLALGVLPGLVGACAFTFGGFVSTQVGHINQLSATAWMPFVVLCADLAQRRRSLRWAILAGIAFAIQLLAGHAQESYMTLWVVLVVVAWRVGQRLHMAFSAQHRDATALAREELATMPPPQRLRIWLLPLVGTVNAAVLALLGVVLVGFGLAAVQLVPTSELSGQSIRGGGMTYLEATSFSLVPPRVLRALFPGYWFNPFGEFIGYVGAVGFAFATLALLRGPLHTVMLGAILSALGLVFALGSGNPLYPVLFELIPGLDLFRVPARWLLVYSFGATILLATGVAWAFTRERVSPSGTRLRFVVAILVLGLLIAAPFAREVPGRILALWLLGLVAGAGLAGLALRRQSPTLAVATIVIVLVELRLAALDFPVRHAVPAEAATVTRPVPAYLQSLGPGKILSVAPTEYEVDDHITLAQRYPGLDEPTLFSFKSALKLDEVMSPNVPLRYGLSTIDGYDGGVLPLRRFLEIATLLVPPNELRADGVLRTRLIAAPDPKFWNLFNLQAVIANKVRNVELEGVRFDIATARELTSGPPVKIELPSPIRASGLALLGSASEPLPPGSTVGELLVVTDDGRRLSFPLRGGEEVYHELSPAPVNTPQPTAGLSRGERRDSLTRIFLPGPAEISTLELIWQGPGRWSLRAATAEDGEVEMPLLLQPGLRIREFPVLQVLERPLTDGLALAPSARVLDDEAALAFLRTAPAEELATTVALAPEGAPSTLPSGQAGPSTFRLSTGPPEERTYARASGSGSGYLVVPDAWFPGWRAFVDGVETPVLRANVHFKAVWVPEGAQGVSLKYDPSSVKLGLAVSVLTAVLAVIVAIRARG